MNRKELQKILENHKLWLNNNGYADACLKIVEMMKKGVWNEDK